MNLVFQKLQKPNARAGPPSKPMKSTAAGPFGRLGRFGHIWGPTARARGAWLRRAPKFGKGPAGARCSTPPGAPPFQSRKEANPQSFFKNLGKKYFCLLMATKRLKQNLVVKFMQRKIHREKKVPRVHRQQLLQIQIIWKISLSLIFEQLFDVI